MCVTSASWSATSRTSICRPVCRHLAPGGGVNSTHHGMCSMENHYENVQGGACMTAPNGGDMHQIRAKPRLSADATSVLAFVVGRGHVSLWTDLDTWHSKHFRGIGHLLIYSRHSFRDLRQTARLA